MAKEQLAVIEMITGMILGKTEGISKVDFTPQKTVCPDVIRAGKYLENVGNTTTMNKITESAQKTGNHLPGRTPESQGIHSEHLRKLVQELAESPDTDMHHLMILRHGNIICEVDFAPYRKGMYVRGQEFHGGDGIVTKGVEATLKNVGRLGKEGMRETNEEIIKMMIEE